MKPRSLFALTLPVLLGYIPMGMTFGLLMVSQGFAWYVPIIFSLFIYAGALQFLSVGLILNHASLLDIATASFLVNLRHIFYGLSLFDFLPDAWVKRFYFIFGITDETYSLLVSAKSIDKHSAMTVIALNHSYWVLGTLIGAVLARYVPPVKGIEFSLVALFVILAVEQIKTNPDVRLIVIAALACLLSTWFFPHYFLMAACSFALVMLVIDYFFYAYRLNHPAPERKTW